MALRDKKMPFAKADPHLPILGMVINEKNYPISPKHLKLKNQDQLEQMKQDNSKSSKKKKGKNEKNEEKLMQAVPGYAHARDSLM